MADNAQNVWSGDAARSRVDTVRFVLRFAWHDVLVLIHDRMTESHHHREMQGKYTKPVFRSTVLPLASSIDHRNAPAGREIGLRGTRMQNSKTDPDGLAVSPSSSRHS